EALLVGVDLDRIGELARRFSTTGRAFALRTDAALQRRLGTSALAAVRGTEMRGNRCRGIGKLTARGAIFCRCRGGLVCCCHDIHSLLRPPGFGFGSGQTTPFRSALRDLLRANRKRRRRVTPNHVRDRARPPEPRPFVRDTPPAHRSPVVSSGRTRRSGTAAWPPRSGALP